MQFSTLFTCLVAAVSINAAPTSISKRRSDIPLLFYSGDKCNTAISKGVTTIYLPTDGKCFGTSPIFSGNTDSAIIDKSVVSSLPTGCSIVLYTDNLCTSTKTITITSTTKCNTFGAGVPIFGAKTVGNCT
ncbi:hypothetical protein PtrSN002B_010309 [Pyrenophora tritici-repentis]|uniref:Uncharacterized protein n=2 Tax=Pyrenophora tritici-repentis TaxID=45151 RepID=A0A2W1FWJ1_9PLEO|nr:uncharacterized protein PTRG_05885 [Pyrenophora tritici-repentis Pt-1C-BFP]KAA8618890.1 hypothetical protein PtrV1_08319 [Pyrenophora tritici-repentis]EDU48805.1 conserved hypothetical protein [Pyrenophora tritici-repentis Pt-1C-BFP]KAF7449456.1 hypothetical protein A1F99_065050 [Pyrenophora tritici-repentis]KAF7570438.1 hypothetical protein PtrM4_104400 [Pyrenophora tritici-repentis]KAG9383700.1 hypothetical protein A1F94_005611 [Pyrenophora tritici-repentis]